jgi:hypothetical protein
MREWMMEGPKTRYKDQEAKKCEAQSIYASYRATCEMMTIKGGKVARRDYEGVTKRKREIKRRERERPEGEERERKRKPDVPPHVPLDCVRGAAVAGDQS